MRSLLVVQGEIRPRCRCIDNEEQEKIKVVIDEILKIKEIPYADVEASIFLCRVNLHGCKSVLELKYTFRTHSWCILQNSVDFIEVGKYNEERGVYQ